MKKLKQTASLFVSMMLPYVLFAQTPNVTNHTPNQQVAEPKEFLNETTHNDFYLMTSSAFGLKKNQTYYKNMLLLYNGLQYGITDNFSFGVSAFLPFMVSANVKLNKSLSNNIHIAGGVNLGYGIDILSEHWESFTMIQPYLVTTFGNKDRNFTFGVRSLDGVVFTLGGQLRLSERFSFITDNSIRFPDNSTYPNAAWIISDNAFLFFDKRGTINTTFSGAIRYMRKRFTFDASIVGGKWLGYLFPMFSATFFFES